MVARQAHCDRHRLQQLLADELPELKLNELHRHLETCPTCRDELTTLAAEDVLWRDLPRFLRRDDSDPAVPLSSSRTSVEDLEPQPASIPAIAEVLERLAPSDSPAMLGRLGDYDILDVIGSGGMGVVLRGYDRDLNRFVAIKVLAPHFASNAAARKRFAREAKASAAVVHPHVVAIHRVADAENLPYLVMQHIAGTSLQQRIDSEAPLELKDILRIGMQAAQGLAAAHAQGLVHRDIKPGNILLENGVERVSLTDFGLARAADDASVTQSGVIAGTPQFMSPEQARGDAIDARSDLFSLGSVLYAMCTGRSPFRAETTMGVLSRIHNETPRPIRQVNSDIPPWLQAIIDRLLAKNPAERYQSAEEVAEVLGQWLAHVQQPDVATEPTVRAAPPAATGRQKPPSFRRLALALAGGLLCLFAAVAIVLELNKGTVVIESDVPNVPIRITRDGDVYRRFTVTPQQNSVRIAAGEYQIEIDGPYDGLRVENETVVIRRGDADIARIVQTAAAAPAQSAADLPQAHQGIDRFAGLLGTWVLEGADQTVDANAITVKRMGAELLLEFTDVKGRVHEGKLRLHTQITPTRFTLVTTTDQTTRTWHGVYQWQGESLSLNFQNVTVMGGQLRGPDPEEENTFNPRNLDATYRRIRTEEFKIENLLGTWVLEGAQAESKPDSITVKQSGGGELTLEFTDAAGRVQEGKLGLHTKSTFSMRFTLVTIDGKVVRTWQGVYKLLGDTLELRFETAMVSGAGSPPPNQLEEDSYSPRHLNATYRRAPAAEPAAAVVVPPGFEAWQGYWTAVRAEHGGTHVPFDLQVVGTSLRIRWATGFLVSMDSTPQGALELDPTASPSRFTFQSTVPTWGIYKFNERGDRLTICYHKRDSKRADEYPEAFDIEREDDRVLCVLQRAPAWLHDPTHPDRPQESLPSDARASEQGEALSVSDMERWQGLWTMVRTEQGSQHAQNAIPSADLVPQVPHDLEVRGNVLRVRWATGFMSSIASTPASRLVLDTGSSPRGFTWEQAVPTWGIYEFNERGDRLTICYHRRGSPRADQRPDSFDVEGHPDRVLCVLQRAPEN